MSNTGMQRWQARWRELLVPYIKKIIPWPTIKRGQSQPPTRRDFELLRQKISMSQGRGHRYGQRKIAGKRIRAWFSWKTWRGWEFRYETSPHPAQWFILLGFSLGVLWLWWDPQIGDDLLPQGRQSQLVVLPTDLAPIPQFQSHSRKVTVMAGERLQSLLVKIGIPQADIAKINAYRNAKAPQGLAGFLQSNRTITAHFNDQGQWDKLTVDVNRREEMVITRTDQGFLAEHYDKAVAWVDQLGGGVITHSIFATLGKSNIPDVVAIQVADVFATDIDFSKDIIKGDEIWVVYRQLMIEGVLYPETVLSAVHLVNKNKSHRAFRFDENFPQGLPNSIPARIRAASDQVKKIPGGENLEVSLLAKRFFNETGASLVRGFIRNPLEFSRVTSQFNLRRFHPILHTIRAHYGVDFAAEIGIPVRVTADGKVSFVGEKTGYGKIIIVQHLQQIETRYAHLDGFAKGLRLGNAVSQGEVIGFVGKTGWATAPHLHYEFRVAGRPHDPLTVPLPHGNNVPASLMSAFDQQKFRLNELLEWTKIYPEIARE
jgi:murein DD-endopeptidase MepM/ murein hydrolase activator NlpD